MDFHPHHSYWMGKVIKPVKHQKSKKDATIYIGRLTSMHIILCYIYMTLHIVLRLVYMLHSYSVYKLHLQPSGIILEKLFADDHNKLDKI